MTPEELVSFIQAGKRFPVIAARATQLDLWINKHEIPAMQVRRVCYIGDLLGWPQETPLFLLPGYEQSYGYSKQMLAEWKSLGRPFVTVSPQQF
jgi:hypothetical protein